ncbi:MAG TPA: ureidoglycolate lyase [Thermomicrobiales bacterium]|nr:ureidoglycolate lyase [Thermomicrobiales bacterium]
MDRIVRLTAELLAPESFVTFGEALGRSQQPPDFVGYTSVGWKAHYEGSGAPLIMTLSSRYVGMRCTTLERHLNVTQTFIPLGRVPAIIAVAAPTDGSATPAPEDVRAFIIDGSCGYVLKAGAWHSPDRYPLYPPSAEIVIITSHDTQHELETLDRPQWQLTQVVDYAADLGVTFEFDL